MYGRNTSECTPAVRIYGHHTSPGWGWVLMDGPRDGTVQHWARPGAEDKGWHCCYPISQCDNAGTEPTFLNHSLTLAPYLFIPRCCMAGRASSGVHHPSRGGWYTISRRIFSTGFSVRGLTHQHQQQLQCWCSVHHQRQAPAQPHTQPEHLQISGKKTVHNAQKNLWNFTVFKHSPSWENSPKFEM